MTLGELETREGCNPSPAIEFPSPLTKESASQLWPRRDLASFPQTAKFKRNPQTMNMSM
jgi:hypothetical protein